MKTFASAVALALSVLAGAAQAAYPERPITFVVPWGAGGGTDTTARYFAAGLEKELGQPVNVVNRTGGSGVVGHSAIATAPADGYTIGMITVEISMMHWQGLTELTPASYTPLALVNADPAGFTVRIDSPFKSVKEALDYARANPGKLKASGTGQGGIWHLALAGLMNDAKIPLSAIPWVPSNGAAPAMQDLVAGGVDIVTASLPEARPLIDAGKAMPLAVMDSKKSAVPERAHDEGSGGQRLDRVRVARHRRPEGHAGRRPAASRHRDQEDLGQQGVQGLRDVEGLRHGMGALGRVRDVHGEGRRRHGRRHEGRRPGEVTPAAGIARAPAGGRAR